MLQDSTATQSALEHAPEAGATPLDHARLYVNRELSLLAFQRRVLEEAQDPTHPLLERVKFLSILGSNLDEFFMVRVSGIQEQIDAGLHDAGPDGMTPRDQLAAIREQFIELIAEAHKCREHVFSELAAQGVVIAQYRDLGPASRDQAVRFFDGILPVLTPLAFDPGRPFPHISNLSLNLSVLIRDSGGVRRFARVKIPDGVSQVLKVGGGATGEPVRYVWLDSIVEANLSALFPGMEILEAHPFEVTRDADFVIQELEAEDLLESVQDLVRQRKFGAVVRVKVNCSMPDSILEILKQNLEVGDDSVYHIDGPLSLSRLRHISAIDRPDLKDHPVAPAPVEGFGKGEDIFATVRERDVLLHHPFDSFQPVVDFLRAAARDPNVLAIKATLYRVGRNSPVVQALLEANEAGKQVAVLVELKARFDEESNMEWARALESEGVHVVYGLVGLKIHSKIAMVVRREGDTIRRYVHLSTGNYNAVTAHFYTDLGFFTTDPDIADDATHLFNYLTGYSAKRDYRKLLVAPINMRERLEEMIRRETAHARAGRPAHVIFKMNALVDDRLIRLLYEASQAGVRVDLITRGVCCLRPGIPGVSANIHVRSIVGRFLEHSRVYYFLNGGDEQVYLGSADLMQRNLNRRVETMFPVEDAGLIRVLRDQLLAVYLADNVKARLMQPSGTYRRTEPSGSPVNSQRLLLESRPRWFSSAGAGAPKDGKA